MARNIPHGAPNTPENVKKRREQLLEAALPLAAEHGLSKVSKAMISAASGLSPQVLNFYFGDMVAFRADLIRHAIAAANLDVVAQALLSGHPATRDIPVSLRQKVAGRMLK